MAISTDVSEAGLNRAREAASAAAQKENADAANRLHALLRRADEAEKDAASRGAELEKLRAEQAARKARATADARAQRESRLAEGNAFLARHPEVKAAAVQDRRTQNAGLYAQLFKTLGLSPAKIERFLDLSVQGSGGSMTKADGSLVTYEFGGNAADAQRQLRELLGEDGFRQHEEYSEKVAPAVSTTTQLAGALYRTATPIAPPQAERLLQILQAGLGRVEWSSRPQYDWEAIMGNARAILSEPQLVELGHLRAQDEFSQAFTQWSSTVRSVPPSAPAGK